MKRLVLAFIAMAFVPVAAFAQEPVVAAPDQQALLTSLDPAVARNKTLVFDFWREVQAGDLTNLDRYMDENYIQHSPGVASGRAGFRAFFEGRGGAARPVKPTIDNLVSLVGEGDLVVMALRREMPDPRNPGQTYTTTWFDMFRVVDGKISEHWDYGLVRAPAANPGSPSGTTPR
ncbi:nuclear transport factor 2 family protein [Brevundimonas sp.]|uniref:nuclear transport factor 2 family protein n=1 Tax=Brevundimonas sp. TaxID=1871086 RepID=UPI002D6B0D08|nr:nuclear transport factor 2 family protein [Brevundimonas sp.]HYC97836.1 nuclear transport factor 2 family protein [Brevundimonas sp.]